MVWCVCSIFPFTYIVNRLSSIFSKNWGSAFRGALWGREKIQGRIQLEAGHPLRNSRYTKLVHGNVIRLRYTDPVTRLNLRPERSCALNFLFRILRRLVGYLLGVLLVALIAAAATFGWQGYKLYQSAVQATPLETLYQSITARPSFVPYDQLPQTYINAVLSVEDSRFVHHHGVDPLSIARALWADLRSGTLAEGGSTITQQLAKNVYFTQEKRMARKAAEMFAALDIEKHYSKQEIFEMYVNTIYFGSGCYGVAEAAEGYFKTDAASLTDAQAVVLAGLPQAPSVYASSPALAHKRARVVLQRMVDCHKLTQDAAAQLSAETDVIPFITRSIA